MIMSWADVNPWGAIWERPDFHHPANQSIEGLLARIAVFSTSQKTSKKEGVFCEPKPEKGAVI